MTMLLVFDTATEQMSLGLRAGGRDRLLDAPGGAKASAALIPAALAMLADAGLRVADLDAIGFGRGPGAFTGLRTACAVAQGLGFGAGVPVLPLDTLMAVAEEARLAGAADAADLDTWVAMDARMDEIYAARYRRAAGAWTNVVAPLLTTPDALNQRWAGALPSLAAGCALAAFGDRLHTGGAALSPAALPSARALLALAEAAWQAGDAVDAALALPLYLRDKVAQTTAERDAARAAREQLAAARRAATA
jgi:tRNA threonylcarbamoyladenosine biosynthesis protein TsaB